MSVTPGPARREKKVRRGAGRMFGGSPNRKKKNTKVGKSEVAGEVTRNLHLWAPDLDAP